MVRSPNPSVMHEIGYARGLDIPVVLIGEKNTSHHLPANLKGFLVCEYKVHDLKSKTDHEFVSRLADTIVGQIARVGTPMAPGEFRIEGYRYREQVDLPYLVKNARHRILILTTNLQDINSRLQEPIKYALEHNVGQSAPLPSEGPRHPNLKVDILTMDPESIVTNARAKQLNRNVVDYRNDLREACAEMKKFGETFEPGVVELGTYVSLPTLIVFIIDDIVVWSVPFPSQQSRMVPHFVVSHDDITIQQFVSYFFSVKSQAAVTTLI